MAEIADTLLVGRSTVYRALNENSEGREGMTSNSIDRVWSIRDAVLKWLYLKAMVDNNKHPVLKAEDIGKTVEWQGKPLTQREFADASDWLRDQENIDGTGTSGHGIPRPFITAKGEALVDAEKSVRGGNTPADPQGVTTIQISNSTNVAIDSPGAIQTYTVTEQVRRAVAVAEALEQASDGSPESVTEAHRIASEIKVEAAQSQPNSSRLKKLVMSAITAGGTALTQAAATDLVHLASHALQAL